MTDMSVQEYSEKSIVVRGEDTKQYKKQLGELGGKWNSGLQGGGGWIFSKKLEDKVVAFVSTGKLEETSRAITREVSKVKVITPEAVGEETIRQARNRLGNPPPPMTYQVKFPLLFKQIQAAFALVSPEERFVLLAEITSEASKSKSKEVVKETPKVVKETPKEVVKETPKEVVKDVQTKKILKKVTVKADSDDDSDDEEKPPKKSSKADDDSDDSDEEEKPPKRLLQARKSD